MMKADVIMKDFLEKLKNGEYKKDNLPNNGPDITDEFIAEQLDNYSKVLKNDMFMSVVGMK